MSSRISSAPASEVSFSGRASTRTDWLYSGEKSVPCSSPILPLPKKIRHGFFLPMPLKADFRRIRQGDTRFHCIIQDAPGDSRRRTRTERYVSREGFAPEG